MDSGPLQNLECGEFPLAVFKLGGRAFQAVLCGAELGGELNCALLRCRELHLRPGLEKGHGRKHITHLECGGTGMACNGVVFMVCCGVPEQKTLWGGVADMQQRGKY